MATSTKLVESLGNLERDSFLSLLSNLIAESRHVQNNPPELIPEEDRVVNHLLNSLLPFSTTTGGGPLILNHVTYFPGRGNLIVEYPGTVPGKILSFVGCHMDVVTANPNNWVFLYHFHFIAHQFMYNFILNVLNFVFMSRILIRLL